MRAELLISLPCKAKEAKRSLELLRSPHFVFDRSVGICSWDEFRRFYVVPRGSRRW